jgi:hypothetical protein
MASIVSIVIAVIFDESFPLDDSNWSRFFVGTVLENRKMNARRQELMATTAH